MAEGPIVAPRPRSQCRKDTAIPCVDPRSYPSTPLSAFEHTGASLSEFANASHQDERTNIYYRGHIGAAELNERTIRRRAVEAITWGIPMVGDHLIIQSMLYDAEGKVNQILYWSDLCDWKNQYLTPNPDTIYFMPVFDTKDAGPMVLEIPPADGGSITGTIMDSWQMALEDTGPAGADKGKGGKYLIVLRNTRKRSRRLHCPAVQHLPGLCAAALDFEESQRFGHRRGCRACRWMKLYPLSAAASPPETEFVDAINIVVSVSSPMTSGSLNLCTAWCSTSRGSSATAP